MAQFPLKQRGVGMIELMIGLAISLFLMIGLGTVYYSMRTSAKTRDAYSVLQDEQRTAMNLLATAVQQSGYFPVPPLTNTAANQFPASQTPFTVAGTGVTGSTNGLTFSVRYVVSSSSPLYTCGGISSTAGVYIDTYSIQTASDGTQSLSCSETVDAGAATVTPLVSGISAMNVRFGVDTLGDGSAFQYQTASATTSWDKVKSVQVTLTFINPLQGQPGQPATISYSRVIAVMNTI